MYCLFIFFQFSKVGLIVRRSHPVRLSALHEATREESEDERDEDLGDDCDKMDNNCDNLELGSISLSCQRRSEDRMD